MLDEDGNPIVSAEPVEPVEPQEAEPSEPAEPAEPAPAAEPIEPAVDPEKKEKGVQKRFNELTKQKHQAVADAEYWRKVATGEIRPPAAAEPQGDFIPPGYPAEPKLDAFDDYDQYNRALVRWEAGRILSERDHQAAQRQIQTARQTVQQGHAARSDAAKERYEDYDEVFDSAPDVNFIPTTFDAIIESDQSADIAYYLAKNHKEAVRIAALSPVQQIKEVARLEDKFKATPAPPVKRVSQAPQPISALGGGGGEAVQKDPEKMSDQEWITWERARVAKLGRRY